MLYNRIIKYSATYYATHQASYSASYSTAHILNKTFMADNTLHYTPFIILLYLQLNLPDSARIIQYNTYTFR
jgi:hypothetical protein